MIFNNPNHRLLCFIINASALFFKKWLQTKIAEIIFIIESNAHKEDEDFSKDALKLR